MVYLFILISTDGSLTSNIAPVIALCVTKVLETVPKYLDGRAIH